MSDDDFGKRDVIILRAIYLYNIQQIHLRVSAMKIHIHTSPLHYTLYFVIFTYYMIVYDVVYVVLN